MTAGTAASPGPPSTRRAVPPRAWWLVALLAVGIGGYALHYPLTGSAAFPEGLRESFLARPWGIYPHATLGAIAILTGPLQFIRRVLLRRRALHRWMGRVYIVAAFLTGAAGFYMSIYSQGGPVTHVAFGLLGLLTAATTAQAYRRIRAGDVRAHRQWMFRSYALIFAAATLRVELPLLIIAFQGDFLPAYRIVSWLCWVPNLIWAEWWIRRTAGAAVPTRDRG